MEHLKLSVLLLVGLLITGVVGENSRRLRPLTGQLSDVFPFMQGIENSDGILHRFEVGRGRLQSINEPVRMFDYLESLGRSVEDELEGHGVGGGSNILENIAAAMDSPGSAYLLDGDQMLMLRNVMSIESTVANLAGVGVARQSGQSLVSILDPLSVMKTGSEMTRLVYPIIDAMLIPQQLLANMMGSVFDVIGEALGSANIPGIKDVSYMKRLSGYLMNMSAILLDAEGTMGELTVEKEAAIELIKEARADMQTFGGMLYNDSALSMFDAFGIVRKAYDLLVDVMEALNSIVDMDVPEWLNRDAKVWDAWMNLLDLRKVMELEAATMTALSSIPSLTESDVGSALTEKLQGTKSSTIAPKFDFSTKASTVMPKPPAPDADGASPPAQDADGASPPAQDADGASPPAPDADGASPPAPDADGASPPAPDADDASPKH